MEDELNSEFGEITYKFDIRDFSSDEVLAYIDRGFLMVNAMHKSQSSESREEKRFTEKISLPSNIDVDSLQVNHDHGLLIVKLHRRRGSTTLTEDRQYEQERERQRIREREERRLREREREMERERERERHSAQARERERTWERERTYERKKWS